MSLKGLVEFVSRTAVRGWAYIQDQADLHVPLEVLVDGRVVGRGRANMTRPDLIQAKIGMGDHAFEIWFDDALPQHAVSRVQVVATAFGDCLVPLPLKATALSDDQSGGYGRRTSRLDLFRMPASDARQSPVFILGAARSGTSALAQALLRCGEYEGFEEGHFFWLAGRFLETIRDFYRSNGEDALSNRFTTLSRAPYTYMTSAVRAVFVAAAADLFPTGKWIDKTPGATMIESARLMQELWPNARFVFMKRRAIENLISRHTKFPKQSFEEHCQDWADSMSAWLTRRDLLGSAAIEVEQLAVARTPHRVAVEVAQFLHMPDQPAKQLALSLSSDLPELTSDIRAPTMDISTTGWSLQQINAFRTICGPMMAAFGYSYTSDYFARPMPSISVRDGSESVPAP